MLLGAQHGPMGVPVELKKAQLLGEAMLQSDVKIQKYEKRILMENHGKTDGFLKFF